MSTNLTFVTDEKINENTKNLRLQEKPAGKASMMTTHQGSIAKDSKKKRAQWGSDWEFLMSCIAFSVGLGNVWRFPYTAYKNGGGAFLVPYVIVLFIVGKPFYYMEMILGQFSSKSCIDVWAISPAFKGIGYGVTVAIFSVTTYYTSLMALTLFYLVGSFQSELPWAHCKPEWGDGCFDSSGRNKNHSFAPNVTRISSAELYFKETVLHERSINDDMELPSYKLVLCLLISWAVIYAVLSRGVKSSGKASYFLALFPYVIMISLFVRAVTLEGAVNGIIFLFKPNWSMILDPAVWYAAITQCFFSLGVCFGGVTMYSSYNKFDHNVVRDCLIVTTLDLFTSLIAGTTIFGILGNLAHEVGSDDISTIVRAGTGLAFISYPEALAKFTVFPQLFAFLFFCMLFVLGIGCSIAFTGVIVSVIKDKFPNIKTWKISLAVSSAGFLVGIVYCMPSGQYILNLIDYFGGTFVIVFLAAFQVIAVSWVYGIRNFLDDVEFMTGQRPSLYWQCCWAVLTPLSIFVILVYFLISMTPLTYNDEYYPTSAYVIGLCILLIGVLQLPIWFIVGWLKNRNLTDYSMFHATIEWGPKEPKIRDEWKEFKTTKQLFR